MPTQPPPLSSTTIRPGRVGQYLKHRDTRQAVMGCQLVISWKSVGKKDRQAASKNSLSLMVFFEVNADLIWRAGSRRSIECMHEQLRVWGDLVGGNRVNDVDYCDWGEVAPNIKGTDSSFPVASVRVLEHNHPTMSTLWGHRDRPKNK